jgi:polar amino acid transport system substrate-binding protein
MADPRWKWAADPQGGAPYVFIDAQNPQRLLGFEKELVDLLAPLAHFEAEFVGGPWDLLLELLARGDVDFVVNGIEVTEEKRQRYSFTSPYFEAPLTLTTRRGFTAPHHTLSALRGLTIGTLPGSAAEKVLIEAGATVRSYSGGQDDLYHDLKLERLDAVLADSPIAHVYADKDATLDSVTGPFGSVQYAIAVRKDDLNRRAALDRALAALTRSGALESLYRRWDLWNLETARLLARIEPPTLAEGDSLKAQVPDTRPYWPRRVLKEYPRYLPTLLSGALITLGISLAAMTMAVLVGLALTLARQFGPAWLRFLSIALVEFLRGTPLLIQLLLIYFGLPAIGIRLSPLVAGVSALGLNYAATESENYRSALASIPRGQWEAAQVLGINTPTLVRRILLPQALRIALPPMTNDFIALLKDSSLVSLVTLTELTKSYTSLANATQDHLGLGVLVALIYLMLGLPFSRLARWAETYFSKHLRPLR